jgi:hypothetical protein
MAAFRYRSSAHTINPNSERSRLCANPQGQDPRVHYTINLSFGPGHLACAGARILKGNSTPGTRQKRQPRLPDFEDHFRALLPK